MMVKALYVHEYQQLILYNLLSHRVSGLHIQVWEKTRLDEFSALEQSGTTCRKTFSISLAEKEHLTSMHFRNKSSEVKVELFES